MSSESFVQVQPDNTGRKVYTVLEERIVNGAVVQVERQLIGLTDIHGAEIAPQMTEDTGCAILFELQRIRKGISLLVGNLLLDIDE